MKKIIIFSVLIAVLIGGFGFWVFQFAMTEIPKRESFDTIPLPAQSREHVDSYIRENINTLSPEPVVLGGTFYVTNLKFLSNSKALVNYEDGHNAFTAEVDFFLEPGLIVKILNFAITKRN